MPEPNHPLKAEGLKGEVFTMFNKTADDAIRVEGYLIDENGQPRSFQRTDLVREDHCCSQMYDQALGNDYLVYNSVERYWAILTRASWVGSLSYCPYCGVELPEGLSDQLYDALLSEVGADKVDEAFDNRKKRPPEYQSDEWWKKRGL